ncbi:hypothetical protein B0H17DRAFT_1267790 [Mycena rosella]|uniref:TATA-binding protein interacting (TIP20) domain-containing protein n=1 Tax=Mycena rosella TaxID=1033263 RepID=A0AAD7GIR3_MYCRO|nr:hypothetical protein B0H17DRAFT_1267790 [Mycena rosella]
MAKIEQDQTCFVGDEVVENNILMQVLPLVEDKISEQAVKCLGQLIKIIRQTQMETVVDKPIDFSGGQDEELRDISGLALKSRAALKTITAELPPDGKIAATACTKLTPKLLGQISNPTTPPEALVETLAILSILISRFLAHLSSATLSPQPLTVLAPLLVHPRPVARKRAIITLAQFVPISQGHLFSDLLATHVFPFLASNANLEKQRTTVHLVAAVARTAPTQIAPVLAEIVPGYSKPCSPTTTSCASGAYKQVFSATTCASCADSMQALEALLLRCPTEITLCVAPIMQAGSQFIKYDPNYRGDDEDEEMADADDDDEDAELDDESVNFLGSSCTPLKLLAAFVGTRPKLLSAVYKDVSLVLISRFGDREETVRLEVWATYVVLLNQTVLYGGHPQSKEDSSLKRKQGASAHRIEHRVHRNEPPSVPHAHAAVQHLHRARRSTPVALSTPFLLASVAFEYALECQPPSRRNSTRAPPAPPRALPPTRRRARRARPPAHSCPATRGTAELHHAPRRRAQIAPPSASRGKDDVAVGGKDPSTERTPPWT